ncbi:expressed unknown protein [Seminavis robusta]|uniref:Uncharacterized protein n=1 Tax=Seminavis robusta TaxID=568900 RepID=A0A9N8DJC6_9STRA|nr:expressed unknown protein [Seminavis robusta]|eukprot:Sro116_g056990.1 n/a (243) ;mRNA; f:26497-27225
MQQAAEDPPTKMTPQPIAQSSTMSCSSGSSHSSSCSSSHSHSSVVEAFEEEPTSVVAVPLGEPEAEDELHKEAAASASTSSSSSDTVIKEPKLGHSFFFFLCDMRRAVVLLDSIGIVIGVVMLGVEINAYMTGSDDFKMPLMADSTAREHGFGVIMVLKCISIVCHLAGIRGAMRFQICPLSFATLWDFIYGVLAMYDSYWIGFTKSLLVLYPHVVLCSEINQGIMTPETYGPREKQSICGV